MAQISQLFANVCTSALIRSKGVQIDPRLDTGHALEHSVPTHLHREDQHAATTGTKVSTSGRPPLEYNHLLCGGPPDMMAVSEVEIVPDEGSGLQGGNLRPVDFAICERCFELPDRDTRVKAALSSRPS